jgi:hypothetical protein
MAIDGSPRSTVATARTNHSKAAEGAQPTPAWSTAARILERCAWVAFPVAGMLWVASRYSERWYHGDEWLMIDRTLNSSGWWSGAFADTHGHLMVGNYLGYYIQRVWLGVEGHQLVALSLCLSLGALQLSIAALLRRLSLPVLVALLAATVVTYFGPGAQDMAWEFQANVNFAFALSFAAAFLALREVKTARYALGIAALLVAAVGTDSGIAVLGAAYVGVLVVVLWPHRLAALALVPPLIAHIMWSVLGGGAKYLVAPFGAMWSFGVRLLTLSAGGLVGGGDTKAAVDRAVGVERSPEPTIPLSGQTVGIIVIAASLACVMIGLGRHRLDRKLITNLAAACVGALTTVAILARTRAFFFTPDLILLGGSRFVQWVALFVLLAFAPIISAVLRPGSARLRPYAVTAAALALAGVFVLNLDQMRPVRHFEESWGQQVKSAVQQAVTLVDQGCPGSQEPGANGRPTRISPEITVRLLQDLLDRGELTTDFGTRSTPEVREAICKPSVRSAQPAALKT